MLYEEENDINQAAYKRLKAEIDERYPKGQFVGLAEGRIVADAATFEAIEAKLDALGFEPQKTMVVIACDDTPDYLEIITPYFTDE